MKPFKPVVTAKTAKPAKTKSKSKDDVPSVLAVLKQSSGFASAVADRRDAKGRFK